MRSQTRFSSFPSVILALALCALGCSSTTGVVDPTEVGLSETRLEQLEERLEQFVEDGRIAGCVALVARRGETAWLEGIGYQDVEAGIEMQADTIFRICSMSKPITSVAVLTLVDEGRIDLDDPVTRFIPEFRDVQVLEETGEGSDGKPDFRLVPVERQITVHDLLTHRSGLTYAFMGDSIASELYRENDVTDGLIEVEGTIGDNVRRIARMPLVSQPGKEWHYGLSTDVLGYVVEVASGKALDVYLEERIFAPLGMNDTYFDLPVDKIGRLAEAYRPAADGIEELPEGPLRAGEAIYSKTYNNPGSGSYFSGGAGLVSTAQDYARFAQMLLNGGELDGVRILDAMTVSEMRRDHCDDVDGLFTDHGDGFGLGLGIVTDDNSRKDLGSAGTFGWGGFYYTYFWVDPYEELVAVILAQLHPWGESGKDVWDAFRTGVYESIQ